MHGAEVMLEYWPVIAFALGSVGGIFYMLIKLVWMISELKTEIEKAIVKLETRMEVVEKNITRLWDIHNEKVK